MIRYIRELRDARIVIEADTSDEIVSLLEKTDKMLRDDGWIEWNGGERPVPGDTKVQTILRRETKNNFYPCIHSARSWRWSHKGESDDIIAYRVVK